MTAGRRRFLSPVRSAGLTLAVTGALLACAAPALALPSSFGSVGARAGQIGSNPLGIAIEQESGDVYVSDSTNHRIDKFGPEGEFLFAFGWGVADGETHALQTCTTTCFAGFEGSGAGAFRQTEGIAVDNGSFSSSHGDVYVVDSHNNRIQKFGPNGEFLLMFGGEVDPASTGDKNICRAAEAASCTAGVEGSGASQFEGLIGRSVAVDSTGTVYVGDRNRVQRFSGEGEQLNEVAIAGSGAIPNLTVDPAKNIYLHGLLQTGVHKYDATGKELGAPRDTAGFSEALSITIGPGERLFVNDLESVGHILSFNAEGEQTSSFFRQTEGHFHKGGIAYSEHTKALYLLTPAQPPVEIVTPPPPGPFVLPESEKSSEIQPTSAKLEALVNPEGPEFTKYHIEYGTTTGYGTSTAEEELKGAGFEDQDASAAITSLAPRTTYHFRVVAENAAKELTRGPDQTFTTLPPVSVDSTSALEVTATSAVLAAELNPHGVATEYRFEYGTTTAYGKKLPNVDGSAGSGTTDVTVSNLAQELTPLTTYHYRVVAHNELGTVEGPDHTFTTQGPSAVLPDGRTWEMVSPPNKHGTPLEGPAGDGEGGLFASAVEGGAFTYIALGPINAETPANRGPVAYTQLLSNRTPSGWQTREIATPHEELSIAEPLNLSEYQMFAPDLSASIVEPFGATPLSPQTTERTPYRREANGEFVPLVTASNVPPGTKFGGEESTGSGQWSGDPQFVTATPDLSHIVLESPQVLASGFKPGFEPTRTSLYELSGGHLTLVSVLPNKEPTAEAGLPLGIAGGRNHALGAISDDGSRVLFETGGGRKPPVPARRERRRNAAAGHARTWRRRGKRQRGV